MSAKLHYGIWLWRVICPQRGAARRRLPLAALPGGTIQPASASGP